MTILDKPIDDSSSAADPFVFEQVSSQTNQPSHGSAGGSKRDRRSANLRPVMWRLHFLGGFLAGPILLILCFSGIAYAWFPQIDSIRFGDTTSASSDVVQVSLADQVSAAADAHADWTVFSVVPGYDGTNTAVLMDPPGGSSGWGGAPSDGINVYVDQTSGAVTGDVAVDNASGQYLRTLHSSLRLGDGFAPFAELATAWFLASLLSGIYLWWPSMRRRGTMAFAARRKTHGRRNAKDWHNALGIAFILPLLFVAASGLTWTNFTGDRVGLIKSSLSVPRDSIPTALETASGANSALDGIDVAWLRAQEAGLVNPVSILLPADDETGWKLQSKDATFPIERDAIVVEGSTGEVVTTYDYSDTHWFNKARSSAISFHQAQLFGIYTQIFMTLLALVIIALILFGYKMWWQRRPEGSTGTPDGIGSWARNAPLSLLVCMVALGWLLPTLALSLVIWIMAEAALSGRQPVLVRWVATSTLLVAGVAQLLSPSWGSTLEDPGAFVRTGMWAWSRPFGVACIALGAIALLRLLNTNRYSGDDESPKVQKLINV